MILHLLDTLEKTLYDINKREVLTQISNSNIRSNPLTSSLILLHSSYFFLFIKSS